MADTNKIIDVLDHYMKLAKDGTVKHIAVSASGVEGFNSYHFVGEIPSERLNADSVAAMSNKLQDCVENWKFPPHDESLDESFACFHCGFGPAGFDFLIWLITHEMARIKAGAPAPLKVAFWCGREPMKFPWMEKVYRPLLPLIGAVEDERALGRLGEPIFTPKPLVDMCKEGVPVPVLASKFDYDLPKDAITITLREAEYWPHRNSDVEGWKRFAKLLKSRGERVIFVRDTAKATEPIEGFETCPPASVHIDPRMWLYEKAKFNFFVSNGPCGLAMFSKKPFMCFIPPEAEDSEYQPNRPSFWRQMQGIEIGSQFPWFTPEQRIVWKKDSFDSICEAYN